MIETGKYRDARKTTVLPRCWQSDRIFHESLSLVGVVESCAVCSRRRYNGGGGADERIQGYHQSGGKTPVREEKMTRLGNMLMVAVVVEKEKERNADIIARSIYVKHRVIASFFRV